MERFGIPAPVSAVLGIPAGRIRFVAADGSDTAVGVVPADPSRGRDVKAAEQIRIVCGDGVLRIEAPEARNRILGPSGSVGVSVQLPAGSRVEASAAAAGLRGVGRLGGVAFGGAHGSVGLAEAGSVRLAGLGVDVTVGRLNGSAEISTQKGGIHITEATGGSLTLGTRTGSICVGAARGVFAVLDGGTACGRIGNTLTNTGPVPGLTVHASTAHGDITARSL